MSQYEVKNINLKEARQLLRQPGFDMPELTIEEAVRFLNKRAQARRRVFPNRTVDSGFAAQVRRFQLPDNPPQNILFIGRRNEKGEFDLESTAVRFILP